MPAAIYILFGAVFTVIAAVSMGQIFFHFLRLKTDYLTDVTLSFVLGSACLSLLVFILAAVHLVHKGVFLAVGVAVIAGAWRLRRPQPVPRLPMLFLTAVPFVVLYFFNAMAPEMSPDGSAYHLGLVARYYRDHGFSRITTNMYANLSQGVEMLFLFAWAFGRHSAAALVHFVFLLVVPLMMFAYGRRFGLAPAAAAGGLFFFLSPVTGIDGTSAYNDVAVAAILFALFFALELWQADSTSSWLVPIGLLAGFAYATKYTAFLAVPYACARLGWKPRRWLVVCGLAAVMILPWMVKNAVIVGNPVSPFFNRWFPNPYMHVSFEEKYRDNMRAYENVTSLTQIPAEVTIRGQKLGGVIGPLFLLTPVALLALREPRGRRLLAAAAVFGATYFANVGTRFLIPCLPFVALALALAVANIRGALISLVLLHALASWPWVIKRYVDTNVWRLMSIPWRAALRIEAEESFLARSPGYVAARMVEDHVPPATRVLSPTQIAEAYTTRDILVGNQSAEGEIALDLLWTPLIPALQPHGRSEFRFASQTLRRVRVIQTATTRPDLWNVTEFRVLRGGRELPRDSHWRLRAHPNPWDVQLAFDNSAVTRWRSWQPLSEGMFMEIDFGRDETIDAVRLDVSRDQYQVRLRLEGVDPQGKIVRLDDETQEYDVAPVTGLRRAAAEELKSRGIGYILMYKSDFGASDLEERQAAWGIETIAERGEAKLYRIK